MLTEFEAQVPDPLRENPPKFLIQEGIVTIAPDKPHTSVQDIFEDSGVVIQAIQPLQRSVESAAEQYRGQSEM